MVRTFKKDPNAVLDYTVDWTKQLTLQSDTIQSVQWVTSPGLTVVSQQHTAYKATAFVSGGVLDAIETLTCRITTAGGRVDDRTMQLRIVER